MNLSSLLSKRFSIAIFALATLCPAVLAAGEHEVSGSATYITLDRQMSPLPNGSAVVTTTSKTVIVADDETIPFHLAEQITVGTAVVDSEGNVITGSGYGHAIDADGDVMYISWRVTEGGSEWDFVSGTGKYEGMEGGGTSENIYMNGNGDQVIRWHGKWTKK